MTMITGTRSFDVVGITNEPDQMNPFFLHEAQRILHPVLEAMVAPESPYILKTIPLPGGIKPDFMFVLKGRDDKEYNTLSAKLPGEAKVTVCRTEAHDIIV